jgi:peroxiredoxin
VPASPGTPAPPGAARDAAGRAVELAGLASDGPAVLAFYKGDCPASAAAAPAVARLAALPGLAVAAVSQDVPAETAAFASAHGWSPPLRVLGDPEPWPASEAWGVLVTPTLVLLARGGRVEAVLEGWSRADVNALAARAAALAGAPPQVVSPPGEGPDFRPG